jgi:hypothetical protein
MCRETCLINTCLDIPIMPERSSGGICTANEDTVSSRRGGSC